MEMVYWISLDEIRLGIMPHPEGGEDLPAAVADLVHEGVTTVVSLLTEEETDVLGLSKEFLIMGQSGIDLISFPISDREVPPSLSELHGLCIDLKGRLWDGESVAIHCRYGIGRSALVAGCLMLFNGEEKEQIYSKIGRDRGMSVPDTDEQKEFLSKFSLFLQNH